MKIRLIILSLIILLFTSGCGNALSEGEIYKKEFIPEKTWTQFVPAITPSSGTTIIPIVYHHPDEYIIYIQSGELDSKGYRKTRKIYVTKDVYDKCAIGSWFTTDSNRGDSFNESLTKKRKE